MEQYFKDIFLIIIGLLMISSTIMSSIGYDDWIKITGRILLSLTTASMIIIIMSEYYYKKEKR